MDESQKAGGGPEKTTPGETPQAQFEKQARKTADRAAAGGRGVQQAALATWQGANTTAERMLIAGGLVGIISFFLPWFGASVMGNLSTNVSGLEYAKDGQAATWFFPIMMALALLLSWLNLHGDPKKRILRARWPILMGASWSWFWVSYFVTSRADNATLIPMTYGGYIAAICSLLVLLAGIMQIQDNVRLVSNSSQSL